VEVDGGQPNLRNPEGLAVASNSYDITLDI